MLNAWLFWAVVAALLWGLGGVFSKRAIGRLTPLVYNLLTVPLDIILLLPFALVFGFKFGGFTLTDFLLLSFITSAYTLYYYVISLNQVSLASTVLATYPLYAILLAVVFLGEKLSGPQVFWVGVLMVGVVILGWPTRKDPGSPSVGSGILGQAWFWAPAFSLRPWVKVRSPWWRPFLLFTPP